MGSALKGNTKEEDPVTPCQVDIKWKDTKDGAVLELKGGGKGLTKGAVHNTK